MPLAKKYGIVSDILGNHSALKLALEVLKSAGVSKILCLGSVVGPGAQPAECIETLSRRPDVFAISGVFDQQAIALKDSPESTPAPAGMEWSAGMSAGQERYLRHLPAGMTIDDTFMMVHSSLVAREGFILTADEITQNLTCLTRDFSQMKICFYGRTCVPMLISPTRVIVDLKETKTFRLDRAERFMINPGSVGLRGREGTPLASFGLFDAENWQMTFYREPYQTRF
jgi:diadenosine tetraphosphatase ApaH/serine/threonine PP2A family protein phosphatase